MERRRLLTTLATGGVAVTAGCLGFTVQEQDEVDSRKSEIDELKSTVSAQQSTIDTQQSTISSQQSELSSRQQTIEDLKTQVQDKESRISMLESRVDQKDAELAGLKSDLETERKELVSKLYSLGDAHRKEALNNWEDAANFYDQGDYTGASNEWGISTGQYFDASSTLSEATTVAADEGWTEPANKITSSMNYVRESGKAANHFALASYYYAHEQGSSGDGQIEKGNDALDEASNYTLYEPKEIDSALGL